jgi:NADH-quinone oxidoreductase subunit M
MIHARCASQGLCDMSGLWGRIPVLSAVFLFFSLASLGLPGLNNFTGEILVLIGTFQTHPVWAVIAAVGVLFGAAYMLRMIQGVLWGPTGDPTPWPDLGLREGVILVPLMVLVVWLGIYPETFLVAIREPVQSLLQGGWPPLPGVTP